jgi:Fructose-1-6-bisphosphatase, C-terminal domain
LVEKAGGLSSNGEISVLDVVVEGYYQKTDFIVGSKEEVERVQRFVTFEKEKKRKLNAEAASKSGEVLTATSDNTETELLPSSSRKKYKIMEKKEEENEEEEDTEFF